MYRYVCTSIDIYILQSVAFALILVNFETVYFFTYPHIPFFQINYNRNADFIFALTNTSNEPTSLRDIFEIVCLCIYYILLKFCAGLKNNLYVCACVYVKFEKKITEQNPKRR